jgi:hypothetical protein
MTEQTDYDWFLIIVLGLVLHTITFWGIIWYYDAFDYCMDLVFL